MINICSEIKDHYDSLAHQIEREDGLVNTRISWMLTFEGFLFATLALASSEFDPRLFTALMITLPLSGILIAIIALLAVEAAIASLKELKSSWNTAKYPGYPPPFYIGKDFGNYYSRGVPVTMILTWITIAIIYFCI